MKFKIPELSLVLLIGPSGAGKSTFARKHFKPTEVISSDSCRALVSDDENNQDATKDAFDVLRFVAAKRLAAGKLTVIDATNVQPESRKPLVELAREFHCLPVAIIFDVPERVCLDRNRLRADRTFGAHVVSNQLQQMRRSLRGLERDGFRHVHALKPEDIEAAEITRERLWNNRREDHGPFDIIGDVHGCLSELRALLMKLGYLPHGESFTHPQDRRVVFLGDLVDRGPDIVGVLRLAMNMAAGGTALCVPGNHETKLMRKLRGKDVKVSHGLAQSLEQLEREPPEFRKQVVDFIDDLVSHYVLDDGKLVVAHAGMKESMQGRGSGKVREFALYGETTGETDEYGLPVRYNWAAEYRGKAAVVYGHSPVPEAEWLNNTICVDTGCVYGGKLTALRYPERELLSVAAQQVYSEPIKPLAAPASVLSAQQQLDDVLDLEDVSGKRLVVTRLMRNVTIREENATAALEVMSRFASNPKWLIYLPPTMSPTEPAKQESLLEHPLEAIAYYRNQGVSRVICERKHMGSRAVVIACRDADVARRRFGVEGDESGVVYTRTGRRFFSDAELEKQLLERVVLAATKSGLWEELKTDWVCIDAELMPWSMKAQELLRDQYAAVGSAAKAALPQVIAQLKTAAGRGIDVAEVLARMTTKREHIERYVQAYRGYCWPVRDINDLKLAPFHLLATESGVHVDRDHLWHMERLNRLCREEQTLVSTQYRMVDTADETSVSAAVTWWEELTNAGGEGMVVKPLEFAPRGKHGQVQPAIKCRGPEYLRIIYGPEYMLPHNLSRLRNRSVAAKRSLALREFALGIEGLERFVAKQPLRRVHECVFGVLAMESEPVDPRL